MCFAHFNGCLRACEGVPGSDHSTERARGKQLRRTKAYKKKRELVIPLLRQVPRGSVTRRDPNVPRRVSAELPESPSSRQRCVICLMLPAREVQSRADVL